jgi:hypothetical protein
MPDRRTRTVLKVMCRRYFFCVFVIENHINLLSRSVCMHNNGGCGRLLSSSSFFFSGSEKLVCVRDTDAFACH